MRPTRECLAKRVASKISGNLLPSNVVHIILRSSEPLPTRLLAAAISRTELEKRNLLNRLCEYLYVALRLPGYRTVTVGVGQVRFARWRATVKSCSCDSSAQRTSFVHCLSSHHQAAVILAEVGALLQHSGSIREAANAYAKGPMARDLGLPTVYSEVVLAVRHVYQRMYSET